MSLMTTNLRSSKFPFLTFAKKVASRLACLSADRKNLNVWFLLGGFKVVMTCAKRGNTVLKSGTKIEKNYFYQDQFTHNYIFH